MNKITGFAIVEVYKHDSTRIKVWVFQSDDEAHAFKEHKSFEKGERYYYIMTPINVSE